MRAGIGLLQMCRFCSKLMSTIHFNRMGIAMPNETNGNADSASGIARTSEPFEGNDEHQKKSFLL